LKKALQILVIAFLVSAGISFSFQPAFAQPVYQGFYWIGGTISAPAGVSANGRQVVVYQEDTDDAYSDDTSGTTGLSGQADQYMVNLLEDSRMPLTVGATYRVATVRGADNYGANPVTFTLSGNGYDFVNLTLVEGGGILPPGPRPGIGEPPRITDIYFGTRLYQPPPVIERFVIDQQPRVRARVTSEYGINISQVSMVVDPGTATARTFAVEADNIVASSGPPAAPTDLTYELDLARLGVTLTEGDHTFNFRAANAFGEATAAANVEVIGGDARILDIPIVFPSPAYLRTTQWVTLQYTLSRAARVNINFFDVSGRIIKTVRPNMGQEGTLAGLNKVEVRLLTDQGQTFPAGIVTGIIINQENNKVLGRIKLTTLPNI
jgi:hypothetical protein